MGWLAGWGHLPGGLDLQAGPAGCLSRQHCHKLTTARPTGCNPLAFNRPSRPTSQATAVAASKGIAIANSVATALSFGGGFALAYSQALAQAFASNPGPLCAALATADATAIAAGHGSIAVAAANALALCH